jgi:hypothetical protein
MTFDLGRALNRGMPGVVFWHDSTNSGADCNVDKGMA